MDSYALHAITAFEEKYGSLRPSTRLPDVSPPAEERSVAGHEFRSPIAVLLWLARCLRADIYRCVGDFTTVVEYWRPEHLSELKKLMAVVKSTMDLKMSLRVRYSDFAMSRARLTAWSDAAMREPKSVGGFVIAIAGPGGDDSLAVLHLSLIHI